MLWQVRLSARMLFRTLAVFVTLTVLLPSFASAQQQIQRVSELNFTLDSFLYIKGQTNLDASAQRELDDWLRTHRTVLVVTDQTTDESFRTVDGQQRVGYEAAEFAIGHGLFNQQGFAALIDSETGLKNISVMLIDFGSKNANFFTSHLLQSNGVTDEDTWKSSVFPLITPMLKEARIGDAVKTAVLEYEDRLESARTKQRIIQIVVYILLPAVLILFLVLLAANWIYNRIVKVDKRRREILAEVRSRRSIVTEKAARLGQLFQLRQEVLGSSPTQLSYVGHTAKEADKASRAIDRASILLEVALDICGTPESAPSTVTWWEKMLRLFSNEEDERLYYRVCGKYSFARTSATGEALSGKLRDDPTWLWAPIGDFENFSLTFNELLSRFNALAEESQRTLENLHSTVRTGEAFVNRLEGELRHFEGSAAKLVERISEAGLAERIQATCTNASQHFNAQLDEARRTLASDPMTAVSASVRSEQSLKVAADLIGGLNYIFSQLLSVIASRCTQLQEREQKYGWVSVETNRLLDIAAKQLEEVLLGGTTAVTPDVANEFSLLLRRCEQAIALADRRIENAGEIENSQADVTAARENIGRSLSVNPPDILRENNWNPDSHIAQARLLLNLAVGEINNGELGRAADTLDKLEEQLQLVVNIIAEATEAHREFSDFHAKLLSALDALNARCDTARAVLETLAGTYTGEALIFRQGDLVLPDAADSVSKNRGLINEELSRRCVLLETANQLFQQGAVIGAFARLKEAESCDVGIDQRLQEVDAKAKALKAKDEENEAELSSQPKVIAEIASQFTNASVRQVTIDYWNQSLPYFRQADDLHRIGLRNPYAVSEMLQRFIDVIRSTTANISKDNEILLEAHRSFYAAESRLKELRSLLGQMQGLNDNIPDSAEVRGLPREVSHLAHRLETLRLLFNVAHYDWNVLDRNADEAYAQLNDMIAKLKGEQKAGAAASRAITDAGVAVREARSWSGSYSVTIAGSPGAHELESARSAYERGEYAQTVQFAVAAKKAAQSAVAEAESSVQRLRRQRQRSSAAATSAANSARTGAVLSGSSTRHTGGSGGSSGGSSSSFSGSRSGGSSGGFSSLKSGGSRGSFA